MVRHFTVYIRKEIALKHEHILFTKKNRKENDFDLNNLQILEETLEKKKFRIIYMFLNFS